MADCGKRKDYEDPPVDTTPAQLSPGQPGSPTLTSLENDRKNSDLAQLLCQIKDPETRHQALAQLSVKREAFPQLAIYIWHSFGVVAACLQEIVSVYPSLAPASISAGRSHRVCNCLALLQCVAAHKDTARPFLRAHIPYYLYPFLYSTARGRSIEYLRLTSLGVLGALVKEEDPEVTETLLGTELIPLCLRIMHTGSELSQTVATFIISKMINNDAGLHNVCSTAERFYSIFSVLGAMVNRIATSQQQSMSGGGGSASASTFSQAMPAVGTAGGTTSLSRTTGNNNNNGGGGGVVGASSSPSSRSRLLKHIIRCFYRLSDAPRACIALRKCLPAKLTDGSMGELLETDPTIKASLEQLQKRINGPSPSPGAGVS